MKKMKTYEEIEPKARRDWRLWLKNNHRQEESVWVIIHKKSSPKSNLSISDVVEEALCFGWIDSVPNKVDEFKFKLLLSPRKPNSVWSALNKKRIKNLISKKLMTKAGLEKIKTAKNNGSWSKLDSSDRLEIPKTLLAKLKMNKCATVFFESISPSSKRAILEWINLAKTEKTREKRINATVALAAKGIRANNYLDLKKLKN